MAETRESYQQVLSRLREEQTSTIRAVGEVDLLCVAYFGARVTLATFRILETVSCVVMPNGHPLPWSSALPKNPLFALDGRRTVH